MLKATLAGSCIPSTLKEGEACGSALRWQGCCAYSGARSAGTHSRGGRAAGEDRPRERPLAVELMLELTLGELGHAVVLTLVGAGPVREHERR